MDWFYGLPEFDIEDSYTAIEFLFHGSPDIQYLRKMFLSSRESKEYIVNHANALLVQVDFERYYKNLILKNFSYIGEDISIVNIESVLYNGFVLGKFYESEDCDIDLKEYLVPFNQTAIVFNNIKNQDTVDFLRVVVEKDFAKENRDKIKLGESITIPILPQFSHARLNNFIYLMSRMI